MSGSCGVTVTLVVALCLGPPWQASPQSTLDQGLARCQELLRRGDLAGAEKQLRELARLHPEAYVVHNNLGALYMQLQRYPQACREFTTAAELNPRVADLQRNLGTCLFLQDDFASAIAPLERAKTIDASDLRTRYQLGYSLLMLGRLSEAQPELEYVGSNLPGDERTLFALVKLYQAKRDEEKAGEAFSHLRNAHPDSVFVHILMGESYDIQEKPDDAIAEYQKALTLASTMPRLHFDLGFLYWENNRLPEAVSAFKQELEINPRFTPALYYLGDIALSQDDPAQAAEYFTQAIARNRGCLDAYVGLGKAYFRAGKVTEAAEKFEQANRLDSNQPDVHYWLANVYRKLGQTRRSQEALDHYQRLTEKAKTAPPGQRPAHDRWVSSTCMNSPPPEAP
jgi:tetratricopeptide (TPR) repeat protein